MTTRKFYKTTFRVEVLSEDPIPAGMDIEDVIREANEGDYVASIDREKTEKLDGQAAADALGDFGSDSGFFRLTEEGEDTED